MEKQKLEKNKMWIIGPEIYKAASWANNSVPWLWSMRLAAVTYIYYPVISTKEQQLTTVFYKAIFLNTAILF